MYVKSIIQSCIDITQCQPLGLHSPKFRSNTYIRTDSSVQDIRFTWRPPQWYSSNPARWRMSDYVSIFNISIDNEVAQTYPMLHHECCPSLCYTISSMAPDVQVVVVVNLFPEECHKTHSICTSISTITSQIYSSGGCKRAKRLIELITAI